jgi:hypothetical protein
MTDSEVQRSAPLWRRSTACHPEECIEVALSGTEVLTRDSKNLMGPVLAFSQTTWGEFQRALRNGGVGRPR